MMWPFHEMICWGNLLGPGVLREIRFSPQTGMQIKPDIPKDGHEPLLSQETRIPSRY